MYGVLEGFVNCFLKVVFYIRSFLLFFFISFFLLSFFLSFFLSFSLSHGSRVSSFLFLRLNGPAGGSSPRWAPRNALQKSLFWRKYEAWKKSWCSRGAGASAGRGARSAPRASAAACQSQCTEAKTIKYTPWRQERRLMRCQWPLGAVLTISRRRKNIPRRPA